ncbi:MAG: hypothetical protein BroJett007_34100 [Chloroflexota bacterium]|nr:MAG: hypothetical protein BroJett007_34100 [Chloroflexota bacterium]
MNLTFTTTNAVDAKFLSLLVAGPPKVGKTTLTKTLPYTSEDKVLVVDADRGSLALSDKNYRLVRGPFDDAQRLQLLLKIEAAVAAGQLEWVVIDGLDEIGKTILEAEQEAERKESKPNSFAPYDRLANKTRSFIRRLQAMPVNSLFITHQFIDTDNPIKFWPDFPGIKLYREIPGLFDTVFAMYQRDLVVNGKPSSERVIQTRRDTGPDGICGNTQYQTGVRDPHNCINAYEKPDLGAIIRKMLDARTAKK